MNESSIAVRYAKALFLSAKEKGVLEKVMEDMSLVLNVCDIPEFQYLLSSPIIKESEKCTVMDEVLEKQIHTLSMSLLKLVFRNGREQFIPAIARNFKDLYKKHKGIRSATLISATPLEEKIKAQIEKVIQDSMKINVDLIAKEDADLIGGFVIRIDDLQYDASVANSLKKVKQQLLN